MACEVCYIRYSIRPNNLDIIAKELEGIGKVKRITYEELRGFNPRRVKVKKRDELCICTNNLACYVTPHRSSISYWNKEEGKVNFTEKDTALINYIWSHYKLEEKEGIALVGLILAVGIALAGVCY